MKTNPVVLLGAGASVGAGVPTAQDMTRKIVDRVSQSAPPASGVAAALHYVVAAMTLAQTLEGGRAYDGVDVERVFSAIEMLAERRSHELGPFVDWRPAVEELDQARANPFASKEVADLVLSIVATPSGRRTTPNALTLARALDKAIASHCNSGTRHHTVYHLLMRSVLDALRTAVSITDTATVQYLRPLTDLAKSNGPLTIATLNYDRAVERLAESQSVACSTGIKEWAATGAFQAPAEGIYLLKLHGSVDWRSRDEVPQDRWDIGPKIIDVVSDEGAAGPLAVVFGARGKLRADGPFLDLLAEFRSSLEETDRLVIVGYSFRDDHINETIRKWISGSSERGIVLLDPVAPRRQPGPEQPFGVQLFEALGSGSVRGERPQRLVHLADDASEVALGRALATIPPSVARST